MEKLKEFFTKNKIVVIALAVVLVIALVAGIIFAILNNNSKKAAELEKAAIEQAINNYILAFNELNADKMINAVDSKAACAWSACGGDVTKFAECYSNVTEEEVLAYENDARNQVDMQKSFYGTYLDYYKIELTELTTCEKVAEVEGLVEAEGNLKTTFSYEGQEESDDSSVVFYLYNGKVVSMDDVEEEKTTETQPEQGK